MARGKGASDQRLLTPLRRRSPDAGAIPGDRRRPPDEFQIAHFIRVFTAKNARTSLRCNVFLTCSYPSHLKHLVLRAFLEDCLPEMLSKLGVLAERGIQKSKKHHAIAPAALGGCGGLGQLWEALAELCNVGSNVGSNI